MKELLAVGKQIFEVAVIDAGIGIAHKYLTKRGEKRTRKALIFWKCLLRRKLGPAFEMRKMGFDVEHPVKFNRVFRQWISTQDFPTNLKKLVQDTLLLVQVEKRMRKFEDAFKKFPSLFEDNKLRCKYVNLMRLRDSLER